MRQTLFGKEAHKRRNSETDSAPFKFVAANLSNVFLFFLGDVARASVASSQDPSSCVPFITTLMRGAPRPRLVGVLARP